MLFHDAIADAARRDGNRPEEFRAAAQRHANAFWFYAAMGGGVWYFLGGGWALIPFGLSAFFAFQSVSATDVARKLEHLIPQIPSRFDLNNPAHVALIDDIREQYSALLADEFSPYSQCIYRPAAILPFSKELIRRALSALLEFTEGRRSSNLLNGAAIRPEVAVTIRTALQLLDDFIDVAPAQLPTEPRENIRVGHQIQRGLQ
jgi:hypothetical protein